jgi:hypothetical protein
VRSPSSHFLFWNSTLIIFFSFCSANGNGFSYSCSVHTVLFVKLVGF